MAANTRLINRSGSIGGKADAVQAVQNRIADRVREVPSFANTARPTKLAAPMALPARAISLAICMIALAPFAPLGLADTAVEIRGILTSVNEARFTTDLGAPVHQVSFREGESFKAGDTLIEFDCRRQKSELASIKAHHREMKVTFEGNLYLQGRGAVGKQELEVSRARADRAAHDARALEIRLERCLIKAPFDGRVRALAINAHETPVAGRPILDIIGINDIELQLIVPSVWLVWLKPDTPFGFKVDETGQQYDAIVQRIGAAVDPVSQTITVIGKIVGRAPEVRAGMSGSATFANHGG